MSKEPEYNDPFRYDPIGNFRTLQRNEMWVAIVMQRMLKSMLISEYKRKLSMLALKEAKDEQKVKEKLLYESRADLFDAYLVGEIDDDTYLEQVELYRKQRPSHWVLNSWLMWLEFMMKDQQAIFDTMIEIHKNSVQKRLPKKYGYDPRKNASKFNYPREDWGKTRQNIYKHRKRKGEYD